MPAHAESITLHVEPSEWLRAVSGLHFPTVSAASRHVTKAAIRALAMRPAYVEPLAAAKNKLLT